MTRGKLVRESELRLRVRRPDGSYLALLHQRLDDAVLAAELGAPPLAFAAPGPDGTTYELAIVPARP